MPVFTTVKNPFSIKVGENCFYGAGRLAAPEIPTILWGEGELTNKEAKQMNIMCWLDFYGLTLIAKRMNRKHESFTTSYWAIRKQGHLKTWN